MIWIIVYFIGVFLTGVFISMMDNFAHSWGIVPGIDTMIYTGFWFVFIPAFLGRIIGDLIFG